MRRSILCAVILLSTGLAAAADEPIVGNWRTKNGETTKVAPCGAAFCITVQTGKFKGRQIGRMKGSGSAYVGEVTDPESDKTYTGSASVTGSSMQLTGCVMKVFCKSQSWGRL